MGLSTMAICALSFQAVCLVTVVVLFIGCVRGIMSERHNRTHDE